MYACEARGVGAEYDNPGASLPIHPDQRMNAGQVGPTLL